MNAPELSGLPAIGEAGRTGGLLKIREKSGGSPRCTRRGPATKRVLISGEKDNRESRRFGCAFGQPQTKYYYSSTRFTVADRDFTFCLPLRSYFDLEGSHILFTNTVIYIIQVSGFPKLQRNNDRN